MKLSPLLLTIFLLPSALLAQTLRDAPVIWHEDDRRDIPAPKPRNPSVIASTVHDHVVVRSSQFFHPGRALRQLGVVFGDGDHVPPAANINSLDEAPNSSWFTNRIGLFPWTPQQVAAGVGIDRAPQGQWTVIRAKSEGATLGFNIRDESGQVYVVKFDPPELAGVSSNAAVISGRLFYAMGYNCPHDVIVRFPREQLLLGDGVQLRQPDGSERPMTREDLDQLLERAPQRDGEFLALASLFLPGQYMGPFDYQGRRRDDPNDRIDHEDRRELRGLRIFCAWLHHWDTKEQNTLDMYVEGGGRHFVRHHLIDFGSTLGAAARGLHQVRGYEVDVDLPAMLRRTLTLGLVEDPWRRLSRPEGLHEVAFFESEFFEPMGFDAMQPNPAFRNLTDRDGYWAAKIVAAFSDEHLWAATHAGNFGNPDAPAYLARILGARRDKIVRHFFSRVPPLDFFRYEAGKLQYADLGADGGFFERGQTRYRSRVALVDAEREIQEMGPWNESAQTRVDLRQEPGGAGFYAVETQLRRGDAHWSASTTVYVAQSSGRVVALER